jgi:predicted GIY-YIG superfamily endonuclease
MADKSYYVYIITNFRNSVLYVGVTNNIDTHGQARGTRNCALRAPELRSGISFTHA